MPSDPRRNRQRVIPYTQKTNVRSEHQDNFGRGEIRVGFYGNSPSEDFQKGARELINVDITEQNNLVKRSGAREVKGFQKYDNVKNFTDGDTNVTWRSLLNYNYKEFSDVVIVVIYGTIRSVITTNAAQAREITIDTADTFRGKVLDTSSERVRVYAIDKDTFREKFGSTNSAIFNEKMDLSTEVPFGSSDYLDYNYTSEVKGKITAKGSKIFKLRRQKYMVFIPQSDNEGGYTLPVKIEKDANGFYLVSFLGFQKDIYKLRPNLRIFEMGFGVPTAFRGRSTKHGNVYLDLWYTQVQAVRENNNIVYSRNNVAHSGDLLRNNIKIPYGQKVLVSGKSVSNADIALNKDIQIDSSLNIITEGYEYISNESTSFPDNLMFRENRLEETIQNTWWEEAASSLEGAESPQYYIRDPLRKPEMYIVMDIPADVLERGRWFNRFGGFVIVFLDEIDADGDVVNNRKAFLCKISKFNGPAIDFDTVSASRREGYNCVLGFYTEEALKEYELGNFSTIDGKGLLGFENINNMYYTLAASNFSLKYDIIFSNFSKGSGFPASATVLKERTILTGFGDEKVLFGGTPSAYGFSSFIPSFFPQYTLDQIQDIARGQTKEGSALSAHLATVPSAADSADRVYYYLVALTNDGRVAGTGSAFVTTPTTGANEEVKWVSTIHDLIVGTNRGEIRAQTAQGAPIVPGNIDFRFRQSSRGSGSSVTARGDYSLFFIGPDGNDLFYYWYDDAYSGLRSINAKAVGGKFDAPIFDLEWDYRRKALWVAYGDGDLALFFLNREFDIQGWSRYQFASKYKITNLIGNPDGSVSFSTTNGKIVDIPYLDENATGKDKRLYKDIPVTGDAQAVVSVKDLFLVPPASSSGVAAVWVKKVGQTVIFSQNMTRVYAGSEQRRVVKAKRVLEDDFDMFELSSFVSDSRLPHLRLEHRDDERATVLSASYRAEIMEE